jgi:hypothetical protein
MKTMVKVMGAELSIATVGDNKGNNGHRYDAPYATDAEQFRKAVEESTEELQFPVMHRSKVPEGATMLPAVWQMSKIQKYKARLNIKGSRMKQGVSLRPTYTTVAS